MQLVLVRHGESEANAANGNGYRMFTGQWDCGLTEHGKEQAESLQNDPVFDGAAFLFSSDLRRARETAAGFWKGPVLTDARLRERSLGEFEGKTVEEIRSDKTFSKYFTDPELRNFRHDFRAKAPGGENYSDVCRRTAEFLGDLPCADKVILVAHLCPLRCILSLVLGLSEEETLHLSISNCTPIVVEVPDKEILFSVKN